MTARTPYALAFVEKRMPPGWDGLHTIKQMGKPDPDIQVVVCTASPIIPGMRLPHDSEKQTDY